VMAIVRYERAIATLYEQVDALFAGVRQDTALDDRALHQVLSAADVELAACDRDLAIVAADPHFALELCMACWQYDWNRNGQVDRGDRHLFQVEFDRDGAPLAEDDPRRTPTYRLDVGDAHWARAIIAFQRAVLHLAMAYRWSALVGQIRMTMPMPEHIHVPLDRADRMRGARDLILAGLDQADLARMAYLAETDDDREWVPSPRQHSYAAPLPVDGALYETWAGVVRDLRALVSGREGLSLTDLVQLAPARLDRLPGGFIAVGRVFSEPRDIAIDLAALERLAAASAAEHEQAEQALRAFLGGLYADAMAPSPMVRRMRRMQAELARGEDTVARKLRYFIWLN
jgi:hypothetical protein